MLVWAPHAYTALGSQKEVSGALELEEEMVVSCCVVLGTESALSLWPLSLHSSPPEGF